MRLLCFFVALLFSADVVLGEGTYQRTKDDKTLVWNNAPKEGDTASWNGDRDAEGYATGFGTLTWYTTGTELYASYYGNMIRGKLDGAVNGHSKGKIAHAIFVDGKRSTRWTPGRSPSHYAIAKRLESVRRRVAKTEKHGGPEENAQPSTLNSGSVPEKTAQHSSQKPTVEPPTAKSDPWTASAQHPTDEATAKPSATTSESAPANVAKIEKENPPLVPAATPSVASAQPSSTPNEPLKGDYSLEESPAEGLAQIAENPFSSEPASSPPSVQSVQHDSQGEPASSSAPPRSEGKSGGLVGYREEKDDAKPTTGKPLEKSNPSGEASISVAEEKPDNSVQVVMQPPSSLRRPSGQEPDGEAKLTKDEVVGVADTAARAAGYNLREYERPRPEYNSASETWSLVYDHKPVGGNAESGEPFSVAVDDKTKKASIVAGL